MAITPSTDTIIDNLRLSVYLKKILKMKMNGINLINSSPISENTNGGISMNVIVGDASEEPTIPKFDKTIVIKYAYKMYAMKRPTAKATSFKAGF